MTPFSFCRRGVLPLAGLALLGACRDLPLEPVTSPEPTRTALQCTVQVRAGTLSCEEPSARAGGARGNVVVGWQNVFVRLTSTPGVYDSLAQVLSTDVTVHNLLGQPIGTPDDGTTVYGVKVFFASGPTVTSGDGTVTVDADSMGTFTASGQRFFHYPQVLQPHGISDPRTWRFRLPPSVLTFTFTVHVETQVPREAVPLQWWMAAGGFPGNGSAIRAVSGASSRFAFAVGDDGMVLSYASSAAGWVPVPSGTDADLRGVWVGTPQRAVAVGEGGVVLHWDGNRWATVRPRGAATASLESVWGVGDTVYAAGWEPNVGVPGRHSVLLRSVDGGATWGADGSVEQSGRLLRGVWASGTGEVFAVGHAPDAVFGRTVGHILRSTDGGATWDVQVFAGPVGARYLYAVWGSGTGVVLAAGWQVDADGYTHGVLLSSPDGGETWSEQVDADLNSAYVALGGNAGALYVAGYRESTTHPGWNDGVVLQGTADGASWSRGTVATDGTAQRELYGAWAEPGATGALRTGGRGGIFRYRNGGAGKEHGAAPGQPVRAMWVRPDGTAVAGGARANGTGGTLPVRYTYTPGDTGWYFNDSSGTGNGSYTGVWADSSAVYMVGYLDGNGVGHRTPTVGNLATFPAWMLTGRRLNGIWGAGGRLFVVADQGSARGTWEGGVLTSGDGGESWTAETVPNLSGDLFLRGVWAAADTLAFAVGYQTNPATGRDEGVIVRRDASGIHTTPSVHTGARRLHAVFGTGAADLYAVGYQFNSATGMDEGVLLRSTDRGLTWTAQAFPGAGQPRRLYAVWGRGPADLWVAGTGGALLHYDGTRWQEMNTGVTTTLYAIGGNATGVKYVAGDGRVILHGR